MLRYMKLSAIALLALLTLAPMAEAQRRVVIVRQPPVVVVHRTYWGPGFWGPAWYDPFWGPYPYAYYPVPNTGEVKLKTDRKDAAVYVDGGYAGQAGKLKRFDLRPGTHDLELRDNENHTFFSERIHVIAGKTIKVDASYRG
jgi:hypothetical protein